MSKTNPRTFEFHQYINSDGTPCSPRENLKVVANLKNPSQWLFRNQRIKAGEIAMNGTDEECEKYLDELRESSEREQNLWRFTQ